MKQLLSLTSRHVAWVGILLLAAFIGTAAGLYWDVPGRIQHGMRARDAQTDSSLYSCPMHPEVTSVHAGKCPQCGMVLARVFEPPKPSCAGCGSAAEPGTHGCCAKPPSAARQLPPGHPPVAGWEAPAGCAMYPPVAPPPLERK